MGIKVTKIPAKVKLNNSVAEIKRNKKRVCGYARVSTDEDEQQNSYEVQIEYYTNYIKNHDGWEFVGMYADEGISGTTTRHRQGFNQMITDAMNGKIDLILTKSVSRFARNTVDSLTNIRRLKEKGVEVYFEKENIYTLDNKGEVLLTIMGSLAQEESRSISENTLWGIKKKMESGKFSLPYSTFLGYDLKDGKLTINKKQAEVVKIIFRKYLLGHTTQQIAQYLESNGYKTGRGNMKWTKQSIHRILTNEKYIGDVKLQKTYTADYLSHRRILNRGEKESFYIENNHEAIIDKNEFFLVQKEIEKRNEFRKNKTSGKASIINSELRNKVVCGLCKSIMKRQITHSNDKYRNVIYKCDNNDIKIKENDLKQMLIGALNDIDVNKQTIDDIKFIQKTLNNVTKEIIKKEKLEDTLNKITHEINALIMQNATMPQNQNEYTKKFTNISNRLERTQNEINEISKIIESKQSRAIKIEAYIESLKDGKTNEYDPFKIIARVDLIEIYKHKIVIKWISGSATEIERSKK